MSYQHLIDAHVHLNNYHESTRRPTTDNVRDLFAKMDEIGVDHAVVITSYKVDMDRPSVEELLDLLTNDPRISLVEGLRWRGDVRTDLFAARSRETSQTSQAGLPVADRMRHHPRHAVMRLAPPGVIRRCATTARPCHPRSS